MSRPSNSDVLDAVRAVRPDPPVDLVDPEGDHALQLFRRIIAEPVATRRFRNWAAVTTGVSVAAAAAAIAVLFVLPQRTDNRAVGSPVTEAPPTPTVTRAPAPAVTEPHTATAVLTINGMTERLTLDGANVSTRIWTPAAEGRPGAWIENRRVDGVLYAYLFDPDGEQRWTFDPDDLTTLSEHPTGATPFELYSSLAPTAGFVELESDDIDGVAVTHLRAESPTAVNPALLPLAGHGWAATSIEGLDLWIADGGVVLRLEASVVTRPVPSVTIVRGTVDTTRLQWNRRRSTAATGCWSDSTSTTSVPRSRSTHQKAPWSSTPSAEPRRRLTGCSKADSVDGHACSRHPAGRRASLVTSSEQKPACSRFRGFNRRADSGCRLLKVGGCGRRQLGGLRPISRTGRRTVRHPQRRPPRMTIGQESRIPALSGHQSPITALWRRRCWFFCRKAVKCGRVAPSERHTPSRRLAATHFHGQRTRRRDDRTPTDQ